MNPLNLLVPSIPKRLAVTQTMWEEFIWDPVKAAFVILGFKFDAFQNARLRTYWFYQEVIDSSGFSSGKTIIDWTFAALRNILLPDQAVGVYYPIFETGKNTFWQYFRTCKSAIFHAQLGRTDEKGEDDGGGTQQGAGAYKAYYRNGSTLIMPAPSFMKKAATQASMRFNTIIIEEYTHIDASSTGIDDQLIGRTTRQSWNKNHPIWGNHILMTAPAKTRMHPAYKRYRALKKKVDAGDARCALFTASYKDYSNMICNTGASFRQEYRVDSTIDAKKGKDLGTGGNADWMAEGLGIWSESGKGWFTEEAIGQCVVNGRARNVTPVLSRAQLEGKELKIL